jgi:hypothetical protein
MIARPSLINYIEVALDSGETFTLELIEDIQAVVGETFKQKKNIIYTRSVIRATLKGVTSTVLGALSETTDDGNKSALFGILSIGTQIFAEASEQADLRVARYFPGKAYVGGINLKPGTYSFSVNYYSGPDKIIASRRHENVPVRAGALNLTEDVCLK